MAEIEHFCFPDDKDHPKFNQVANTKLQLYSACNQMDGEAPKWMTIGEANITVAFVMHAKQWILMRYSVKRASIDLFLLLW
ncbi:hypothetical protein Avbf_15244 [Armadillidium vulgare]|nr:hypothetical protein Avbf_15244 [Armadillidium vulgare]